VKNYLQQFVKSSIHPRPTLGHVSALDRETQMGFSEPRWLPSIN
jgi:hypothetical protein